MRSLYFFKLCVALSVSACALHQQASNSLAQRSCSSCDQVVGTRFGDAAPSGHMGAANCSCDGGQIGFPADCGCSDGCDGPSGVRGRLSSGVASRGWDSGCGCGAGECGNSTPLRSRLFLDNPIARGPATGISLTARGPNCHSGCEGCEGCRGGLLSSLGSRRGGGLGSRFGGWGQGYDQACSGCGNSGCDGCAGSRLGSRLGIGNGGIGNGGLGSGIASRFNGMGDGSGGRGGLFGGGGNMGGGDGGYGGAAGGRGGLLARLGSGGGSYENGGFGHGGAVAGYANGSDGRGGWLARLGSGGYDGGHGNGAYGDGGLANGGHGGLGSRLAGAGSGGGLRGALGMGDGGLGGRFGGTGHGTGCHQCGGAGCHGCIRGLLAHGHGGLGHGRGMIPHTTQPPYGADGDGMGQQAPTYAYPYYTARAPRDFLTDNPPSIGW